MLSVRALVLEWVEHSWNDGKTLLPLFVDGEGCDQCMVNVCLSLFQSTTITTCMKYESQGCR